MKQKEELFELIHSLSKHEKRFFSLFASAEEGEHVYLKIFDLIEKQNTYDEEKIRNSVGSNKNVFAVQKHYLFELILNRLALLNSGKRTDLRIMLTQSDILYKKGLYLSNEKIIRKIKTHALEEEKFGVVLEVLRSEHLNAWRKHDLKGAEKIIEEEKKVLAFFNSQKEYTHLANEIITLLSSANDNKNKNELERLIILSRSPLLTDEKNALTFSSKYTLFHTLFTLNFVKENGVKQYYYSKKANTLYDLHPEKIKVNPLQYLYSLHNLINTCNSQKKYDEAKICIDKLHSNSSLLTSEREKVWAFFTYHDSYLDFFQKSGRFMEGARHSGELIQELNQSKWKLDPMHYLLLLFDTAKIFFGAGEHKKCLTSLNKIRNYAEVLKNRPDIEVSVRIFYLLVHFEKDNTEMLERLTKQKQNILSETNQPYKTEHLLLDFFGKKLPKFNSKKELKEDLVKLKNQLILLSKDKHEKKLFDLFDYVSWFESKIENKSFEEIILRKQS